MKATTVHLIYVSIWPATPAGAGERQRGTLLRKSTARERDPVES